MSSLRNKFLWLMYPTQAAVSYVHRNKMQNFYSCLKRVCLSWGFGELYLFINLIFMFPCMMTQYTKMTNKVQLCRTIYYSLVALHVSSDIFAHHQEHLNCVTSSGITHYVPAGWYHGSVGTDFNSVPTLPWSQLAASYCVIPEDVIQFRCSWWWAKISLETCRAAKE
jgi:hypothetical protein